MGKRDAPCDRVICTFGVPCVLLVENFLSGLVIINCWNKGAFFITDSLPATGVSISSEILPVVTGGNISSEIIPVVTGGNISSEILPVVTGGNISSEILPVATGGSISSEILPVFAPRRR